MTSRLQAQGQYVYSDRIIPVKQYLVSGMSVIYTETQGKKKDRHIYRLNEEYATLCQLWFSPLIIAGRRKPFMQQKQSVIMAACARIT